jgi:hypothetical protein
VPTKHTSSSSTKDLQNKMILDEWLLAAFASVAKTNNVNIIGTIIFFVAG